MAKDNVSQWDTNPDANTDVGGNNIAENCPPSGINNAIRSVMAQIKALYENLPRLNISNTFSGNNTFSGSNNFGNVTTFKKIVSSVASSESNDGRGIRLSIDGTEQTQIYHDNTRTVMFSSNQGFRFDSRVEFTGSPVKQSAGGSQDPSLRGYRLFVDGVEQASLVHENAGAVFATSGYFRAVVGGTEISRNIPTGFGVGVTLDKSSPADTGDGVFLRKNGLIWANATDAACGIFKRTGSDGALLRMVRGTSQVGNISVTTSGTAYNTTSDERLKEDFKPIDPSFVDQINVYNFAWKNGSGRGFGVKAQEFERVLPSAVTKGDAPSDMWGVDYSRLVPFLVETVKDLRKRVAELEGK